MGTITNHDQLATTIEHSLRSILEASNTKTAPLDALKTALTLAARFVPEDTAEESAIWNLREYLAETDDEKRIAILNDLISGVETYRDAAEARFEREFAEAGRDHAAFIRQHSLGFRDVI